MEERDLYCEGYWGERDSGWKVCKTIKSTVFSKSFINKKLDISSV
jgi:hypothetical protein